MIGVGVVSRASSGDKNYGFRRISEIESHLQGMGFITPVIEANLVELYEKKCLEGREHNAFLNSCGVELRVTPLGRYHVTELVKTFQYTDGVVIDTPIIDDNARAEIEIVREIKERTERARAFIRYLNKSAQSLIDANAIKLWNEIHDTVLEEIKQIEEGQAEKS